jgi:hypothetical protein
VSDDSFVFPAAADCFVLSSEGPVTVDDFRAGDSVLVLRRGQLATSEVMVVRSDQEPIGCIRLLTSVGDIVVEPDNVLLARGGPLRARDVAAAVADGKSPRLEVVRPPAFRQFGRQIVRDALRELVVPPRALHFPQHISARSLDELFAAYEALGIALSRRADDRWLVLPGEAVIEAGAEHDLHARTLLQALAWAEVGTSLESRVTLEEHDLRRAVLCALVRDGLPFSVRWTPGYRPIEARISLLSPPTWSAFVSVAGAIATRQRIVRLTVAGERAALVVGLALAMPQTA